MEERVYNNCKKANVGGPNDTTTDECFEIIA